jgi:cyclopropane-fatty-acyl-phospholipid synthase
MNDQTKVAALCSSLGATLATPGVDQAAELLHRLFKRFDGRLALRLWDGTLLKLGNAAHHEEPAASYTLVCRSPSVVRSMVIGRDPLRMAEAYFRGEIDIEGDFFAAMQLKDQLESIRVSARDRMRSWLAALRLRTSSFDSQTQAAQSARQACRVKGHARHENSASISFHYDVSNDFYALWLDEAMVYSCAYFEAPEVSLAQAQQAKLDHICRKLQLKPGERMLDIGCGWGALVIHAARHYGVHAHGVTLSRYQLAMAQQRIDEAGLRDRVTVELCDYRDLQGVATYDKVSSVGMFEHVGLKNLPVYFTMVQRLLKPAGLFLNHGITHFSEGWTKTLSTEFINRYVFPDGQLTTIGNVQRAMEHADFEIADVESLRPHYALTLRHWVSRLEQHHERALHHVSESTYRIWRLYMSTCALEFESGEIGVYQVLASKRNGGLTSLPLTRRQLYP